MATYKVRHKPGNYQAAQDTTAVVKYIMRPDKTRKDLIFGGAVLPEIADLSFEGVAAAYHNEEGTHLRHSILSFSPDEPISVSDAAEIAKKAVLYYEDEYQILAAVHTDRSHLHIHFAMNTTNYNSGHKYAGKRQDYHAFHRYLNEITKHYGISVNLEK